MLGRAAVPDRPRRPRDVPPRGPDARGRRRPAHRPGLRAVRTARPPRTATHGYRDAAAEHAFAVEDPGFNALYAAAEHALARIAEALGHDPGPHRARAAELTDALVRRLWSEQAGQFLARDLRAGPRQSGAGPAGRLVAERSAAGLLPLVVPGLPRPVADALLRTVAGEHFGLGSAVRLLPSYDLRGAAFDRRRYWRGPAWFNVNWLLVRGPVAVRGAGPCGRAGRRGAAGGGRDAVRGVPRPVHRRGARCP
ncbi:hypothetical protein TPA0909_00320 [Streptomyces albus]|nr:hypothetical protein TPA0909_00320 [Streptomyces albus]